MIEYLECGYIVKIHGLNGGLVINHMCDSYEAFSAIKKLYFKSSDGSYNGLKIRKCSPYKGGALVLLDTITDADMATKLRGQTVFAHRSEIPCDEGSFFIVDLLGLDVLDADTKVKYGILKDVINSGAQDIYVVEGEDGKLSYVPVIDEFVIEISLEKGIFIRPIEGMIE
ncbi:MAG: 16S rRNA processing protein RimM [Clostridia bacterium]|nr:16S rRNA processing protein RimM [Clostridia bacterium]